MASTTMKRDFTAAFGAGLPEQVIKAALKRVLVSENDADAAPRTAAETNEMVTYLDKSKVNVDTNQLVAVLDTTENGALQYANTGYAPLDLFFQLVRTSSSDLVQYLVTNSWAENAEETIKILMHGRDARDGKGERAAVRTGLLWMRRNKPKTYLMNLIQFTELGYFKDLLQIAAEIGQEEDQLGTGKDLVELELYAAHLRSDLDRLNNEQEEEGDKKVSLSLAAKWAPSEGYSFDRKHKFASRMARLLFPEDEQCRKRYRQFLSRARAHLSVIEALMSAGRWSEIDFGRVPSRAHRLYRNAFQKHEEDRYNTYLEGVRSGKEKIHTSGTQPHELVKPYISSWYAADPEALDQTIEAQWSEMIRLLKAKGGLGQSLAVVDVSGSMSGQPMEVAVALGLVTAEINEGAFHNRTITFSERPQWEMIRGDSLMEKVQNLQKANWSMSTDLEAVFELILSCAVKAKVKQEDLPKTLFIFSDMQFNAACRNANTETLYRTMRRKFLVHGYTLPGVVFWNLRASTSGAQCPVTMDESGTAMVSGFSAELLRIFMDGAEMNPMTILRRVIEPYKVNVDEEER